MKGGTYGTLTKKLYKSLGIDHTEWSLILLLYNVQCTYILQDKGLCTRYISVHRVHKDFYIMHLSFESLAQGAPSTWALVGTVPTLVPLKLTNPPLISADFLARQGIFDVKSLIKSWPNTMGEQ